MCSSCSTGWISEAEQIVAALIPATTNLVTLAATLRDKDISADDLRTIENAGAETGADLQLLQSLITLYQRADASAQPGLLNQIQLVASAAQSRLKDVLPALHIKDAATQTKISAVVGILLAEVESLAAIVQLLKPDASPEMRAGVARQAKKKPPLTASEFVTSYNAVMKARTGDPALDAATARMRIHFHGRLERMAGAGLLK